MRKIDKIIVHCTATPEGRHTTVEDVRRWHLDRGWSDIGYHFLIYLVVEGQAVFESAELPDLSVDAPVGTTILIPACCKKIRIHTNSCRLLEVFV